MQKTLIYIDTLTKTQVMPSGSDALIADYVRIERGQWQVLCIQFVERIPTDAGVYIIKPAPIQDGTSLLLVGDNDFNDDNDLMFKSYQSAVPFDTADPSSNRFNIEGDWVGFNFSTDEFPDTDAPSYTANPSKGQISVRINADTAKFVTAIGDEYRKTDDLYINIKQYTAGIDNPSTIAWINFVALNTVRDWKEPIETPTEGAELIPFINSYLRNPIELEYSSDNVEWHTELVHGVDIYYHFRIANTATEWSNSVPIIHGKSVKLQYSPDNSTWQDAADDLTKYIRFSLDGGESWGAGMLVKGADGADGYTPIKGTDYYTESDKTELLTELKSYVDNSIANGEW